MKNLSIIPILLIILLSGCQEKKETYGIISVDEKYIVGFKETFLGEDEQEFNYKFTTHQDFKDHFANKRISGDTLHLSTAFQMNYCLKYEPTIFIRNNKIKLDYRPLDDQRCKSQKFVLLEYILVLKEPEKYEIIY